MCFPDWMVGYPESLTDPSYYGQILVLSYPMIGNYGIPSEELDEHGLPKHFESTMIHVRALVVADQTEQYSHWNATTSLSDWLANKGIPGLYGVDTRALIQILREKGSCTAKVIIGNDKEEDIPVEDIDTVHCVARVSTKKVLEYGKGDIKVLIIDCGMKTNQIRCFLKRGVSVKIVPHDHDISKETDYDGLFISNGPGNPELCTSTVENIRKVLQAENPKPVFGICMGNQLLARAAGATTYKLKYGNRGHNQPCIDRETNRCYLTLQNHGFAVDSNSLPEDWEEYFYNANDNTNEGIRHKTKPFFSVQFHPEACAGPEETEFLFDKFISVIKGQKFEHKLTRVITYEVPVVRKVLVLGSGGLSIGQAGEFDYSGSQCIKALKEEKIETILINPNIATVQTSAGLADRVYFLPVTPQFVTQILEQERPDGILVSFGGQTALNCGVKLFHDGVFERLGVKVLGTPIPTVIDTEDRNLFVKRLEEIDEKAARSFVATNPDEAVEKAEIIGYPVIVRAAFALGGLGSGFADNRKELLDIVNNAFASSEQVLIEMSMKGWKEIEYEVVRDAYDNCITVCNMENFDPLGVHTGESIVVAPSQTLTNAEYQMLRNSALRVVRHLGVIGECNIQFALNPISEEYRIIEVNARLSRSSALASKATGYPLAFVSAKLALGKSLPSLKNSVTKVTTACFEPSLDYIVVKIPLWDFHKFTGVKKVLSSSMKSVGEIMSIGRTFEEAIQSAIRMVNPSLDGLRPKSDEILDEKDIDQALQNPDDQRIFWIHSALTQGYSIERIYDLTKIDTWFLHKLHKIVKYEKVLSQYEVATLPRDVLLTAKQIGFSDRRIGHLTASTELAVRSARKTMSITPVVKQIDTVAAEFPAQNNYLYMTYNGTTHDVTFNDKHVIVLGSGGYRIGTSVEFDWCAVGCARTLKSMGYQTIMINCNPETVSTDYDECDRLYFEALTFERVLDIYEIEKSLGVVVSVGGQIPNNLAMPLYRQNVNIFGTSPEMIDSAENRYKFSRLLDTIGVRQPTWTQLVESQAAEDFCESVGYPCLVRPSYVLSGAAMKVVNSGDELREYLSKAIISKDRPLVISKFIQQAKEIEVDGVAFRGKMMVHAISEHVENAGVHSGDATLVCPPQDLQRETIEKIEDVARKIAIALNISGPFNIQFIAKENDIKVIECNVRTSRSLPFVSKTLKIDFISAATKALVGRDEMKPIVIPAAQSYVGVKVPQFSFTRLQGADPLLGVEMSSTGECACFGATRDEAYLKALLSTGFTIPKKNILLSIGSFSEKQEFLESAKILVQLGYTLYGSEGTADFLEAHQVPIKTLARIPDHRESSSAYLRKNLIDLFINLPTSNRFARLSSFVTSGYTVRRLAADLGVPLITNIKCAKLFVQSLAHKSALKRLNTYDCQSSNRLVRIPGLIDLHVHLRDPGQTHKEDWESGTAAALAGGVTILAAMPNTQPSIVDKDTLAMVTNIAASKALCDYVINLGASSSNAVHLPSIASKSGALKMYLDPTFSNLQLDDMGVWMEHFKQWPSNRPIILHAEKTRLAAALFMCSITKKQVHVAHVSLREEIMLIKEAKAAGLPVTCEVCPHHLLFSQDDIPTLGANFSEVRPRLATKADQDFLWNNLDVIDTFGTDHAPHTIDEKTSATPPPGFPGLETMLPLLLTQVHKGRLTLDDIVLRLHTNPKKIFNLPDQPDTFVEVDLDKQWTIPAAMKFSRCQWTPFAGFHVRGAVKRVVLRGEVAYVDGKVLVKPGFGQNLRDLPTPSARGTTQDTPTSLKPTRAVSKNENVEVINMEPPTASAMISDLRIFEKDSDHFKHKHVLSVTQFGHDDLRVLFKTAVEMRLLVKRAGTLDLLKGKILANVFYEPSTRTASSFAAAILRLGGQVVSVNETSSSVVKGESLPDTIRTLERYSDVIVLRHPDVGAAAVAAAHCNKPIINGGDGIGEHPSQALLDVFTIREELGTVNGLNITLVGDLKHGRTTHSLVKLLSLYRVKLTYVSPESLQMPQKIKDEVEKRGIPQREFTNLDQCLAETDVLYVTRVQKERFTSEAEFEKVKSGLVITPEVLTGAKDNMIVMHPLPRVDEISPRVDSDPRAAYFRQMENGMYIRMALFALLLGDREK